MSDIPTPETDAAWDKYISPPYTYGAGELRILAQRLERERDEARQAWYEMHSSFERSRDEAEKLMRERDEAHKIAERAIDDLGWFNETNAQRLRAELEQLKEGAK